MQAEPQSAGTDSAVSAERIKRFLSVASHDLQSPLRHIAMYADILRDDLAPTLDTEHLESLTAIIEKAKSLQALTKALMTYAGGTPQIKPEAVDLNRAIGDIRTNLGEQIAATGAVVDADMLPTVFTDPIILTKVLESLIINAIAFRGSERPSIRVSATETSGEVEIVVKDNGRGIDEQYWERIFDAFWKNVPPGIPVGPGLGLTISRELMQALRGDVRLISSGPQGSIFAVSMPLKL